MIFDFWEDFGVVALILVFFGLYNLLSDGIIKSRFLALIVTILVIYLIVVPYDWFRFLLFGILFLGGALAKIKPAEWF